MTTEWVCPKCHRVTDPDKHFHNERRRAQVIDRAARRYSFAGRAARLDRAIADVRIAVWEALPRRLRELLAPDSRSE